MTEWYEQPYPTGDPIDVPGFPRSLFPPDAADSGKQPSASGHDVEAMKRIAWRLGRWEGPASNFDQKYSNVFAHGKGPGVIQTGMAGLQRQQGIQDTGWVGKETFAFLLSAVIPDGFKGPGSPGEPAVDAYTQSLLVMAWTQFQGKEPVAEPPVKETVRAAALKRAITQLGYKENPPNTNRTKFGLWYGLDGNPWCAMFDTWCRVNAATEIAKTEKSFAKGRTYAYVPYMVRDARNNQNGLSVTLDPQPGDCVCFDWTWDGVFDHTGFFEKWTDRSRGSFSSIEGNTSVFNNSNGGEVMRRDRNRKSANIVFIRVTEP